MTLQQLTQLLRDHGIEADESLGRPFVRTITKPSASGTTHLNPTTSYLRPFSAVIAAATKSLDRPKWFSTI
jgi:hypothetical protein